MGDPFSNWYESSHRARTYHESVVRHAGAFRTVHAGVEIGLASRALDQIGRALIAVGRFFRRAAGRYVIPDGCGCYRPVARR